MMVRRIVLEFMSLILILWNGEAEDLKGSFGEAHRHAAGKTQIRLCSLLKPKSAHSWFLFGGVGANTSNLTEDMSAKWTQTRSETGQSETPAVKGSGDAFLSGIREFLRNYHRDLVSPRTQSWRAGNCQRVLLVLALEVKGEWEVFWGEVGRMCDDENI